jgi:hypothetical protein
MYRQPDDRLITVMSTKSGKHGDPRRGTEVPRRKLVDALEKESDLFTTQGQAVVTPWKDKEIPIL